MAFTFRKLLLPQDYAGIVALLNQIWAEPTSVEKQKEADAKLYTVGKTWLDEKGLLQGYDRSRQVALNEAGQIVGFAWSWRAPWTEAGYLCNTLVVDKEHRNQGIGHQLLKHIAEWGANIGASNLITEIRDDDEEALQFVQQRGFYVERHSFQSVLDLTTYEDQFDLNTEELMEREGFRYLTLADEPGEASEYKLYELYKETLVDIPGFLGSVPSQAEWRKWYLFIDGYQPDLVLIMAKGEKFIGVSHLLFNTQTKGMYHEYTGVSPAFRGKKVGLILKRLAIRLAQQRNVPYLRTDNDSTNIPILAINKKLGYKPLRGHYRIIAPTEKVVHSLFQMEV